MKKKQMTAIISLALGGVILSSAAIANFATSNGYNIYKESVRKLFDQTNYTFNAEAIVSIDGETITSAKVTEQYDEKSQAYAHKETSYDKTWEERPERTYEQYYQDEKYISRYSPESINGEYKNVDTYEVNDMYVTGMPDATFSKSQFCDEDNKDMFDKYFNFASSCVDLFVGDIKNNFVLTGTENGLATYEANLDLFQIPEVVNSGADVIVSQVKRDWERRKQYRTNADYDDDFDNYIVKLANNPFISGANCTVTVDEEGRLVDNVLSADVSGKDEDGTVHTLTVKVHISMSDYGTTVPEKIDLNGSNIKTESQVTKERINELELLLENPKLEKEERENYESEKAGLTKRLKIFEEKGPFKNGYIEYEETAEVVSSDEATPAAEAEVIGGADGPTDVAVAE